MAIVTKHLIGNPGEDFQVTIDEDDVLHIWSNLRIINNMAFAADVAGNFQGLGFAVRRLAASGTFARNVGAITLTEEVNFKGQTVWSPGNYFIGYRY